MTRDDQMFSWKIVYIDLFTLLLVFMVVMTRHGGEIAMETQGDESSAVGNGRGIFCISDGDCGGEAVVEHDVLSGYREGASSTRSPEKSRKIPNVHQAKIITKPGKITIEFNNGILFETSSAELSGRGRLAIREILPAVDRPASTVIVEGHTDDRPILSNKFPSNWELSAARAAAVARTMIAGGIPAERMRIVGRADTSPIASNDTAFGRQNNRRVAIVVSLAN